MFYETVVYKLLAKFPHKDKTLSDLSFIHPNNRAKSNPRGIIRLCNRFMTDVPEEIDAVVEEYRAFCVAPGGQLPFYDSKLIMLSTNFGQQCQCRKQLHVILNSKVILPMPI